MVNSPQSTHIKPPKAIWEVFLWLATARLTYHRTIACLKQELFRIKIRSNRIIAYHFGSWVLKSGKTESQKS